MRRWLLGTAAILVGMAAWAGDDLAGRYYLHGVHEVGSELVLGTDGRFSFGLSYGAVDQEAQGSWKRDGDEVVLRTDSPPPAGFSLGEVSDQLLDAYGTEPDKPTLLAVQVTTPRLGLVWSNMQITAEFSNGLTRSGMTGRRGLLGFLARTDGPWQGAVIRRVSVAYPAGNVAAQWFDIDSKKVRGVAVHFEPGDLATSAFKTASFHVVSGGGGKVTLTLQKDGPGRAGWQYSRQ